GAEVRDDHAEQITFVWLNDGIAVAGADGAAQDVECGVGEGQENVIAESVEVVDPELHAPGGEESAVGQAGEGAGNPIGAVIVDDGEGGAVSRGIERGKSGEHMKGRAAQRDGAPNVQLVVVGAGGG